MKKDNKAVLYSLMILTLLVFYGCTGLNDIKESQKVDTKNVFTHLLITDTTVSFPEYRKTGTIKGRLINTSDKVLGGNFNIVFYSENGGINKIYNAAIPGSELKPGETKIFSLDIDKFEYETYDFDDDNIFEKTN